MGGKDMPEFEFGGAPNAGASLVMPPGGADIPKGEAAGIAGEFCLSEAPGWVAAMRRGSFEAGSGIMRGSCGEIGV